MPSGTELEWSGLRTLEHVREHVLGGSLGFTQTTSNRQENTHKAA